MQYSTAYRDHIWIMKVKGFWYKKYYFKTNIMAVGYIVFVRHSQATKRLQILLTYFLPCLLASSLTHSLTNSLTHLHVLMPSDKHNSRTAMATDLTFSLINITSS